MKNNELIKYKENIFTKISNFIKSLFTKKDKAIIKPIAEVSTSNKKQKDNFTQNILIKENEEDKRIKILKLQYENGEIDEDGISDEDIDKIIEMYESETEKLNADTERRKIHIAQMLKELKNV